MKSPSFAFVLVASLTCSLIAMSATTASAQTLTVIHNFRGQNDGGTPEFGLARDSFGNLYGTTYYGGAGNGNVFRLQFKNNSWIFTPLYNFQSQADGFNAGAVVVGPNGSLYGSTVWGGTEDCGCGTLFNLRPSPRPSSSIFGSWNKQMLQDFAGDSDGYNPWGSLTFADPDHFYGTTVSGGPQSGGTVFQLTYSGGSWSYSNIYTFSPNSGGYNPYGGVIKDAAGNLYGMTTYGGSHGNGTVYQLVHAGSGWTVNILYSFQNGSDGENPWTGLAMDQSGNLYGSTGSGGLNNQGAVFQLSPSGNGSWTFNVIYSFDAGSRGAGGSLAVDSAGNLYGITVTGGHLHAGSIFKLTRNGSAWTYINLHDFLTSDGDEPSGNIVLASDGNLYGTTSAGGPFRYGTVWQLSLQ